MAASSVSPWRFCVPASGKTSRGHVVCAPAPSCRLCRHAAKSSVRDGCSAASHKISRLTWPGARRVRPAMSAVSPSIVSSAGGRNGPHEELAHRARRARAVSSPRNLRATPVDARGVAICAWCGLSPKSSRRATRTHRAAADEATGAAGGSIRHLGRSRRAGRRRASFERGSAEAAISTVDKQSSP